MPDPRFNGSHLVSPRQELYDQACVEVFGCCGPQTTSFERMAAITPVRPLVCPNLPPNVPYALFDLLDGNYHPLRIGLTAIGRAPENDIVLGDKPISRRHCVILVHATGGCEVYDTASRNGTRVNGSCITRVWLLPDDMLRLCDRQFMLTGRVRRDEAVFGAHAVEAESQSVSPTTEFGGTSPWCAG